MKRDMPGLPRSAKFAGLEVAILAGGLSSRMGRDKARLRLGSWTLLGHVRRAALELGVKVRVIRQDRVPRCGPLGGILTGLLATRSQAVLFLSCDAPFVSAELLRALGRVGKNGRTPVFTTADGLAGFPLIIPRACLALVERQVELKRLSLQALARALEAQEFEPSARLAWRLFNVNTPEDFARARAHYCRNMLRYEFDE